MALSSPERVGPRWFTGPLSAEAVGCRRRGALGVVSWRRAASYGSGPPPARRRRGDSRGIRRFVGSVVGDPGDPVEATGPTGAGTAVEATGLTGSGTAVEVTGLTAAGAAVVRDGPADTDGGDTTLGGNDGVVVRGRSEAVVKGARGRTMGWPGTVWRCDLGIAPADEERDVPTGRAGTWGEPVSPEAVGPETSAVPFAASKATVGSLSRDTSRSAFQRFDMEASSTRRS